MIRVLLAEDYQVVRQGLRALLEQSGDIVVVAEAADGQTAVNLVRELAPDVVVMDIGMPVLNGIAAMAQLQNQEPKTEVIILSMYGDDTTVRQALRSGARGYVLKRSAAEELLLAIRAATRGESYLSPGVSSIVLNGFLEHATAQEASPLDRLTIREHQTLQLVAEGRTNNEIAEILQLSAKTVEKHRGTLMAKLQVHDVVGLVRAAIKHGLIFPDE
jgi:two-component system, NarL family, response regulator NreC